MKRFIKALARNFDIVKKLFWKKFLTNREKESILSIENKKGENKMEFYSMEQFEIMADAMEEVQDWLNFEADMETHPFD